MIQGKTTAMKRQEGQRTIRMTSKSRRKKRRREREGRDEEEEEESEQMGEKEEKRFAKQKDDPTEIKKFPILIFYPNHPSIML